MTTPPGVLALPASARIRRTLRIVAVLAAFSITAAFGWQSFVTGHQREALTSAAGAALSVLGAIWWLRRLREPMSMRRITAAAALGALAAAPYGVWDATYASEVLTRAFGAAAILGVAGALVWFASMLRGGMTARLSDSAHRTLLYAGTAGSASVLLIAMLLAARGTPIEGHWSGATSDGRLPLSMTLLEHDGKITGHGVLRGDAGGYPFTVTGSAADRHVTLLLEFRGDAPLGVDAYLTSPSGMVSVITDQNERIILTLRRS